MSLLFNTLSDDHKFKLIRANKIALYITEVEFSLSFTNPYVITIEYPINHNNDLTCYGEVPLYKLLSKENFKIMIKPKNLSYKILSTDYYYIGSKNNDGSIIFDQKKI